MVTAHKGASALGRIVGGGKTLRLPQGRRDEDFTFVTAYADGPGRIANRPLAFWKRRWERWERKSKKLNITNAAQRGISRVLVGELR